MWPLFLPVTFDKSGHFLIGHVLIEFHKLDK